MHEGFTKECWGGRGVGRNEAGVERGGQVLEASFREFTPRTRKNHRSVLKEAQMCSVLGGPFLAAGWRMDLQQGNTGGSDDQQSRMNSVSPAATPRLS